MAGFELFEFQETAASAVYESIMDASSARRDAAVVLSAPTGAGKTVIAASVLERLFYGTDTTTGDPSWTVLWLSDLPQINAQTQRRLQTALGSRLLRMEVLADSYNDDELRPGTVYFLNTQKVHDGNRLVTNGDKNQRTAWEFIGNTIRRRPNRFVVFIDEAHRGTGRGGTEATSIMQRFILGHDALPPPKVVVGITATPARFNKLLARTGRTVHPIDVPWEDVTASGILKEKLVLDHSNESQAADMTLLRQAGARLAEMTTAWREYAQRQGITRTPVPVLVVQVADARKGSTGTATDITGAVDEIRTGYHDGGRNPEHDLPAVAFAHSFDTGTAFTAGKLAIRHLEAAKIEGDPYARVVFFKSSLNTGWDCPRAEVMMSFRTARDETAITQLIGRLVRTPLARRITEDERLNAVHLFLPHYDRDAVTGLQRRLEEGGNETTGPIEPVIGTEFISLSLNPALKVPAEAIREALAMVKSERIQRTQKDSSIIRYVKVAGLITDSGVDAAALEQVRNRLASYIHARIEQLDEDARFQQGVKDNDVIDVRTVEIDYGTPSRTAEAGTSQVRASDRNLATLYNTARRRLDGEVARRVVQLLDPDLQDPRLAKLKVFTFADLAAELDALDDYASNSIEELIADINVMKLSEEHLQRLNDLRGGTRDRTTIELVLPITITPPASKAASMKDHLYVTPGNDEQRNPLNTWERAVLKAERAKPDYVGWLRNIDRQPWALAIAYENPKPALLYPDLLIFRRRRNGTIVADIIDPHSPSLEDAAAKARALARYAGEPHAITLGRIELVKVVKNKVVRLDAKKPEIRKHLLGVSDRAALDTLFSTLGKHD